MSILGHFPSRATITLISGPQPFWYQGLISWKIIFPQTGNVREGWFQDDSSTLHLLCTLLLI